MDRAVKAGFGLCAAIAAAVLLVLGFGFSGGIVQFVIGAAIQVGVVLLGIGAAILLARMLRGRDRQIA